MDGVPERLEKVKQLGATPIDYNDGDPAEQIKAIRKGMKTMHESLRTGEEKMAGVMCGIDAVGYQAHDLSDPGRENGAAVIDELIGLVNPTGAIGVIGAYMPDNPGAPDPHAAKGEYMIPFAKVFEKGLTVAGGQCPVKKYNSLLLDLVIAGKANPDIIVSHHLPIDAAPDAYDKFDKRVDGYTKVILKPDLRA